MGCKGSKHLAADDSKKHHGNKAGGAGGKHHHTTTTTTTTSKHLGSAATKEQSHLQQKKPEDDGSGPKKETTTYETTVVKHSKKEGEELMQHLKDDAFKTLVASLKPKPAQEKGTVVEGQQPPTATQTEAELVDQMKQQAVASIGKQHQKLIEKLVEQGVRLVKEDKVKSMNELQEALERAHGKEVPDSNKDLVLQVVNSCTGYLTAKGTEAAALLSNLLANSTKTGLHGVMNETEKTTVKVMRTITETVITADGKVKETTRVVTSDNAPANAPEFIKDILNHPEKIDALLSPQATGATTTTTTTSSGGPSTTTKILSSTTTSVSTKPKTPSDDQKTTTTNTTTTSPVTEDQQQSAASNNTTTTTSEVIPSPAPVTTSTEAPKATDAPGTETSGGGDDTAAKAADHSSESADAKKEAGGDDAPK